MPNWCSTTVIAVGPAAVVADLVASVATTEVTSAGQDATAFDLDRILPVPQASEADVWWRVRHWGTKWNVDARPPEILADGQVAVWHFSSAWSGPVAAIRSLAARWPSTWLLVMEDEPSNNVSAATAFCGDVEVEAGMSGGTWSPDLCGALVTLADGTAVGVGTWDGEGQTWSPSGTVRALLDTRAGHVLLDAEHRRPADALDQLLALDQDVPAAWAQDMGGGLFALSVHARARLAGDAAPLTPRGVRTCVTLAAASLFCDPWDVDLDVAVQVADTIVASGVDPCAAVTLLSQFRDTVADVDVTTLVSTALTALADQSATS